MSKLLKYARVEHERRFLLARLPEALDPDAGYERISDLYLAGTRLRLRLVLTPAGEVIERKLNQKLPDPDGAAERRIITSVYLDAAEYALLARLPGSRLEKRRYRQPFGAHTFAFDVFEGSLAGLVLAELELTPAAARGALALPDFTGCEVTALALFTGGALAGADPARVLAEARRLLSE
jgi:hypothetical protein